MTFPVLQQALLCHAARFFTTQKNFPHCEMKVEAKKNRCESTGFFGVAGHMATLMSLRLAAWLSLSGCLAAD
jgi:hypothetical protein